MVRAVRQMWGAEGYPVLTVGPLPTEMYLMVFLMQFIDKEHMKVDPQLRVMVAKLLAADYVDAFLDGNLHMNSAAYFKKLESDGGIRADEDEGLQSALQIKELSVQDKDGSWVPVGGIINPVRYWTEESADFNMLCLYMFSDQPEDTFDDRNLAFGDAFILITNLPEFIQRVRKAAVNLGRTCGHGPVEYVGADAHNGHMGAFRKFSQYQFQKEFRIALKGGGGVPTTLGIGDIRDICAVGATSDLGALIQRLKPVTTV
jgi:hypothetical protein